MLSCGP
jgi:hypothetical protein